MKLVIGKSVKDFTEVRCSQCNMLLYRRLKKSEENFDPIETKCKRCGLIEIS